MLLHLEHLGNRLNGKLIHLTGLWGNLRPKRLGTTNQVLKRDLTVVPIHRLSEVKCWYWMKSGAFKSDYILDGCHMVYNPDCSLIHQHRLTTFCWQLHYTRPPPLHCGKAFCCNVCDHVRVTGGKEQVELGMDCSHCWHFCQEESHNQIRTSGLVPVLTAEPHEPLWLQLLCQSFFFLHHPSSILFLLRECIPMFLSQIQSC